MHTHVNTHVHTHTHRRAVEPIDRVPVLRYQFSWKLKEVLAHTLAHTRTHTLAHTHALAHTRSIHLLVCILNHTHHTLITHAPPQPSDDKRLPEDVATGEWMDVMIPCTDQYQRHYSVTLTVLTHTHGSPSAYSLTLT